MLELLLVTATIIVAYNMAYECHDNTGRNVLIIVVALAMAVLAGISRMSADFLPILIFALANVAGLGGKYRARAKAFAQYRKQDAKNSTQYTKEV